MSVVTTGSRRVETVGEQLSNELQYITAARNAAEAAKRAPGAKWTNFAAIGGCNPSTHHTPTSVEAVQRLIRGFAARGEKCRVAGTGKSPNSITFTPHHLLHTEGLSRILAVDIRAMTITCEGGALLADIHRVLESNGLMLRCVPSIVDMTIAGAIGTAAHSSGIATKSICSYVTEMDLVDGQGNLVKLSRSATPKELRLAACHLGALGVVTRVVLQAERRCTWRMISDCTTVERLHKTLAQHVMTSEYYRFWWTPHTSYCYETIGRRLTAADEEGRGEGGSTAQSVHSTISASTTKSNTPIGRVKRVLQVLRHESSDGLDMRHWQNDQASVSHRIMQAVKGHWLRHQTLEAALVLSCYAPQLQPIINKAYQQIFLKQPQAFYGSAVEAFTFDCLFKQWACEWAIEAHRALEAFDLIRQMVHSNDLHLHFPIEFRFSDEEDIALSPGVGRKTCWIGLVMYRPHGKEAPDTQRAYHHFCALMQRLDGRPHWAKTFSWRRNDVANAYGMHWQRWLEYRQAMDPHGLFVNDWMKTLLTQD